MANRRLIEPFGRGFSKGTMSLLALVCFVLFAWAFTGESTARSIDSNSRVVGERGESLRAQDYRYVWVQGLTVGNGFAGMFLTRNRKTVRIEFLGPCGARYAGPIRIKNRKFRAKVTFRGGGWKVEGKFTRNNQRIKGKLRSWSKGCDTGTRKFLLEKL